MIRVLQVVNNMHRAGLETMLMNYYRKIDRTKIQFDFLTHRPERSDYDDEIESMGGKVYYAPRLYPQNYPAYFKYMDEFFNEHPEYQIVHSHIDAMSYLPLLAAKKAGVPVRIAHSHNTSIDKDFKYVLKRYFKHKITSASNVYCACGEDAGKFLFPNKEFLVLPNAVDAKAFKYNEEIRDRKRKELNLKEQKVIGHVGRMSYQKNHKFLIQVFYELLKKEKNCILLLVGTGEKEEEIKELVTQLGIQENVLFLGNRSDVDELYQVMDLFILPSLFEGVPLVGVEAQFANLPCLFSNNVPKEVEHSNKNQFIDLSLGAEKWAEEIVKILETRKLRAEENLALQESKYDIEIAYKKLEELYTGFSAELQ